MSEIQSFALRVQQLSDAVDFWNRWMLWGLVFGALAAVWIGLTTALVMRGNTRASLTWPPCSARIRGSGLRLYGARLAVSSNSPQNCSTLLRTPDCSVLS